MHGTIAEPSRNHRKPWAKRKFEFTEPSGTIGGTILFWESSERNTIFMSSSRLLFKILKKGGTIRMATQI